MRTFKRLFCVLLALAALSGVTVFPVNAADSGYQVTVAKVQRFTPGSAFDPFDPDTAPKVSTVSPGDVFVLTVAFQNNTASEVDIRGFAAKLYYDASKVTPYKGTSPFKNNPYWTPTDLMYDYNWVMAGNGKGNGFVSVSGGGAQPYGVRAGEALVLACMAFQANADASGEAVFTFDSDKTKTNITGTTGGTLSLAALQTVSVNISGTTPEPGTDSGYQLTVAKVQRFTPGSAFDPDTAPEVSDVSSGDVFVLTVAFQNNAASAVDISGFAAKMLYNASKVTPYTGTTPFKNNPYQNSTELSADYEWSMTGNGTGDGFVAVAGGGVDRYSVSAGETLVLARMAFQANADASGEAVFTFDSDTTKTTVTSAAVGTLTLAALQPVRVTLNAVPSYEITSVSANGVTLTNSTPVTLAVSYFDADGKFMSAFTQSVPANAGSVSVTFSNASKAYVMLFDDSFRPLCERFPYVMK